MAQQIGIINVGNTGYGNFQLSVEYDLVGQSSEGNYSDIKMYLYFHAPNYIAFSNRGAWLDGNGFGMNYDYGAGKHHIGTTSKRVYHDNNGNAGFSAPYGISTSYVINGEGTTSWVTLPNIPRYAKINKIEVRNMECISGKINAWYDRVVNETQYRLKVLGGGWGNWIVSQNNLHSSAVITLTSLRPNTQYVIEVSCRNKESGLWTTNAFNFSTLRLSTATANNVNYNHNKTVTVSRASGTMTHKIYLNVGGIIYNQVSGVQTSVVIPANDVLSDALLKNSPNSSTNACNLFCETIINGVSQGTTQSTMKYVITQSDALKPIMEGVANKDVNALTTGVTGVVNQYVQGVSTVEVSIARATSRYYASLSRVEVICMGNTYSKAFGDVTGAVNTKITFTAPNSTATQNVVVKLYDTRGQVTQTTTTLYMLVYQKPLAVWYNAEREFNYNPPTTLNAVLNYSKLNVGGVDKNHITASYRVKESTVSTWGSWVPLTIKELTSIDAYTMKASIGQFMSNYDQNKIYNVQMWIGDKFNAEGSLTSTVSFTVNKGVALLRWMENGTHLESDLWVDNGKSIMTQSNGGSWFNARNYAFIRDYRSGKESGSMYAHLSAQFSNGGYYGQGSIGNRYIFFTMPSGATDGTPPNARLQIYEDGILDFSNKTTDTAWAIDVNGVSRYKKPIVVNGFEQPYLMENKKANYNIWGYEKWSDGRLIQTYISDWEETTMGDWAGSFKSSSKQFGNKDFPFAFVGKLPIVHIDFNQTSTSLMEVCGSNATLLNSGGKYLAHPTTASTIGARYTIRAEGRWK